MPSSLSLLLSDYSLSHDQLADLAGEFRGKVLETGLAGYAGGTAFGAPEPETTIEFGLGQHQAGFLRALRCFPPLPPGSPARQKGPDYAV